MTNGRIQKRLHSLLVYGLALFLFIFTIFPIYWMVVSALRGGAHFFSDSKVLYPNHFSLDLFRTLLRSTDYLTYYRNSFVVAVFTTIVTIVSSAMFAYVTARFRFRGSRMLMNVMLIAYMLPSMLLAIPLLGMFVSMKIDDTLLGLTIAHISMTLPFGVWMLNSFYHTIPFDLEESAMVDGATRMQNLIRVVLPLVSPGLITVGVFSFIVSFTDYTFGVMLTSSDSTKTIPIGLAVIKGATELQWGELLAGGSLIAVPMIVLFAFVTKYFVKGLTAGAVKG